MKQVAILLSLLIGSCSDLDDGPERIDKLRAIGVAAAAGEELRNYLPGSTVNLTFILASPVRADISVAELSLDDEPQLELTRQAPTFRDLSELRLFEVAVSATIPAQDQLDFDTIDGSASIAYALAVSQGSESELVRGRIKVYATAPDELRQPQITITSPSDGTEIAGGVVSLTAEIEETPEDNFRIGWFVADGVVERRRALSTQWEDMSPGSKTIIVTARDLSTGYFTYDISDASDL